MLCAKKEDKDDGIFFTGNRVNKKMVSNIFKVEKEKPVNLEFYMQKNIVNIASILKILLLLIFRSSLVPVTPLSSVPRKSLILSLSQLICFHSLEFYIKGII